nr:MAG TPA: hypothetical protein [Herelleviridae sp.]
MSEDKERYQKQKHIWVSHHSMSGVFGKDVEVHATITSVEDAYARVTTSGNPHYKSYLSMSMEDYINVIKTLINKPVEVGEVHFILLTDNINHITPDTTILMWREEQNA